MRIGIVLPSVPGYSETFFRSKIAGLQKAGYEVILFVKSPQGAKEFICPVKVHPMLFKNSFLRLLQTVYLFARLLMIAPNPTQSLLKIMRNKGFSLLQSIQSAVIGSAILPEKLDWLHFGFATPAIQREFLGAAIGAKVAVSFRGFDLNQTPLTEKNPYKLFWPQIDKVHSISHYLVKKSQQMGLPQTTPYQIITPALDVSLFTSNAELRVPNTILLVGRLHWIKGIEHFLEALSLAKIDVPDLKITVVGAGEERERLVFAAYQLGVFDGVDFVGKKSHTEVQYLMQTHEIFVQYSHQEGFCNAALEAQAAEMLCVVSDAEGLQENVLDGQTGWVVPKRNPEALAKKLIEVLKLPESEKNNIRKAARKRIEHDFSIEMQQQKFIEFYQTQ